MSQTTDPLLTWHENKDTITRRITAHKGRLKILLKTKNEPIFLRRWIRHHAKIAGLRNLIIFDNMSDDPEVLALYRKHARDLQVVRFPDMHDCVHDTTLFPELYAALAASCEYFSFLDTDEYLIMIDERGHHAASDVQEFLERNRGIDAFPGTWMADLFASDTRFFCGSGPGQLGDGLAWGKPVIRSNASFSGFINHNNQLGRGMYGGLVPTNLFILHLLQFSPKQRIAANLQKLVSYGFSSATDTMEQVLTRDLSTSQQTNFPLYVSEIKRYQSFLQEGAEVLAHDLVPGSMELMPDGTIKYYGDTEREAMTRFLRREDGLTERILKQLG